MEPYKDEKGRMRFFDSYKLEYIPFNVVRNQLVKDLDSILATSEAAPMGVLSLL